MICKFEESYGQSDQDEHIDHSEHSEKAMGQCEQFEMEQLIKIWANSEKRRKKREALGPPFKLRWRILWIYVEKARLAF